MSDDGGNTVYSKEQSLMVPKLMGPSTREYSEINRTNTIINTVRQSPARGKRRETSHSAQSQHTSRRDSMEKGIR